MRLEGPSSSHTFAGRFERSGFAALVRHRMVLFITILGIPIALFILFATGIWAIYRVARGWLALRNRKPMYTNT